MRHHCTLQKIGKIFKAVLEKKAKTRMKNRHFIPCKPGLRIFQKINLAQTIRHIVLYNPAKIGKILRAVLEKRQKHLVGGQMARMMDGKGLIYMTILQSQCVKNEKE